MSSRTYEAEPAQHVVRGSVHGADGVWWSGSITVPVGPDALAFVELERHGPETRADDGLAVSVPVSELTVVGSLLGGLVADLRETLREV